MCFAPRSAGLNRTADGQEWLTERQIEDLRDQIVRHPSLTLLEANEAVQRLLFKAQVDVNEVTGEADPVVLLIDFAHPGAEQSFMRSTGSRIDTPGCVKSCIIPDIVLFVNGIPLVVVEAKIGDPNTANPMYEAFVQLLRYRNGRVETQRPAGLREGESRLFSYEPAPDAHLRREGRIWHDHFRSRAFLCLERHLAREPTELCSSTWSGARAGEHRPGLLPPADTLLDMLRTCAVFMDTDSGGG